MGGALSPALGSGDWLLDNSAWYHRFHADLPKRSADRLVADLEAGNLIVSPPFRLEAGYSARSESEYRELMEVFDACPAAELSVEAVDRSVEAQAQLVRTGHHRIPPVDLLVAAIAEVEGIGVFHYDSDFDLILDHTDLDYESRWLADRGTI